MVGFELVEAACQTEENQEMTSSVIERITQNEYTAPMELDVM